MIPASRTTSATVVWREDEHESGGHAELQAPLLFIADWPSRTVVAAINPTTAALNP